MGNMSELKMWRREVKSCSNRASYIDFSLLKLSLLLKMVENLPGVQITGNMTSCFLSCMSSPI